MKTEINTVTATWQITSIVPDNIIKNFLIIGICFS